MSVVQTLITAAKDSRSLFIAAGFGSPKSLVNWNGREVLLRAMDSYVLDDSACWVAVNADEDREWNLSSKIRGDYPSARVAAVSSRAQGALASALLVMEGIDLGLPLVVSAGDSMIEGGIRAHVKQLIDMDSDAGAIAFPSSNPRWSYLSVGDRGEVRQVEEKRVIGPLATTGVFYFRRASDFLDAATWCLVNNASHNGAYFVSSTLNYMVSQGRRVHHVSIPRHEYRSWSLPIDFTTQSE